MPVLSCCSSCCQSSGPPPKAGPTKPVALLVAVHNPAARQIVRRKLHCDLVSRQNPDEILAHLAGNVRQNLVLVFQLNAEHRVRQRLDDRRHHFNGLLRRISGVVLFLVFVLIRHVLPKNGSKDPSLRSLAALLHARLSPSALLGIKRRPLQRLCHSTKPDRSSLSAASKSTGRSR